MTETTLEERDEGGHWVWVWIGVEGRCLFGAAMTGLALEKGVGSRLCRTVGPRFASSDIGRTVTCSLDVLVWSFLSRLRNWAYLLTSGWPKWLKKSGLSVLKEGPVNPTVLSISRSRLAGRLK